MDVELARHQWRDGHARLQEARREPRRYRAMVAEVEVLLGGLRGRVGQSYTLAELASAYDGADDWAQEVLGDIDHSTPEFGTIADAAFHLYARGATDYRP